MCINSLFAPFVVKRGNPPFRGRVGKAILDLRICSSCVGVVHATKADAEVDKEHFDGDDRIPSTHCVIIGLIWGCRPPVR
jgi:hypothetical protein